MNMQTSMIIDGKEIPYYQFIFKMDMTPHLNKSRKQRYLSNGQSFIDYVIQECFDQFDFTNDYWMFERASVLFLQGFHRSQSIDFDNQNYKPLIDAVKKLCIFPDDNYKHLSMHFVGQESQNPSMNIYIFPMKYAHKMMNTIVGEKNIDAHAGIMPRSDFVSEIPKLNEEVITSKIKEDSFF